jgi:hypothetical protein
MSNSLEGFATLNQPGIQIYNFTAMTTTAVACQFNVPTSATTVRVRISNLHASNNVAFTLSSSATSTVPQVSTATTSQTGQTATFSGQTMLATAGAALAAGDGIRIGPNSTLEINITGGTKIWLIASAASTPVQVAALLQNG